MSTQGLAIDLDKDRTVYAFPIKGKGIAFAFENKGKESTILLSAEAVEAMYYLSLELSDPEWKSNAIKRGDVACHAQP